MFLPNERICKTLNAFPAELIQLENILDRHGLLPLLSQLWSDENYSDISCFLFGSRVSGSKKKFSDYDIGLSGGVNPLKAFQFLEIKESILLKVDDLSVAVDVTDFDNAPQWFLAEVRDGFHLICGKQFVFQQFMGKIYGIKKIIESS